MFLLQSLKYFCFELKNVFDIVFSLFLPNSVPVSLFAERDRQMLPVGCILYPVGCKTDNTVVCHGEATQPDLESICREGEIVLCDGERMNMTSFRVCINGNSVS